nr:hypothetical protein [Candidatus Sigynarchaeota archaeon]
MLAVGSVAIAAGFVIASRLGLTAIKCVFVSGITLFAVSIALIGYSIPLIFAINYVVLFGIVYFYLASARRVKVSI